MKRFIIYILLFFPLYSQCQVFDSELLYNKIVLLREVKGDSSQTGTGFLLSSNNQFFLVTAKHVADCLTFENSEIFFRDSANHTSIGYKIKELIARPLVSIFNDNSDFFLLKLEPLDLKSYSILKNSSMDIGMLAYDRESINRNVDVLVMGYPLFDLNNFNPITFKSCFSSSLINIKMENFKKPFLCYLLENPSMEGFSGGPVFVGVQDRATTHLQKTLIVGLVTGTTLDKTGGKFAIITPAFHLLDLINNKNGQ
jgi:hypothetical protein